MEAEALLPTTAAGTGKAIPYGEPRPCSVRPFRETGPAGHR